MLLLKKMYSVLSEKDGIYSISKGIPCILSKSVITLSAIVYSIYSLSESIKNTISKGILYTPSKCVNYTVSKGILYSLSKCVNYTISKSILYTPSKSVNFTVSKGKSNSDIHYRTNLRNCIVIKVIVTTAGKQSINEDKQCKKKQ